ncbi:hypothetical protein LguiA_036367 [Lonicera macranthoides]
MDAANESMEKVASYGLSPNMILYLMRDYHMEMSSGSNLLFFWSAATNFMPVLGAFLADSCVGRFRMIGFGSIISLLGMILLWATTMIPQARPPPCEELSSTCIPSTNLQLVLLCSSFGLMSIGAGGIRSSSLAFGADQLNKRDNLKSVGVLESYFSWYYVSMAVSILLAFTCVVYIQDNMGWSVGFGVPVVLMFFSALSFYLASSFYIKLKAKASFFTGFVQVIVVAYKNRHFKLSLRSSNVLYHRKKESMLLFPSDKLRFLNKACIIKDPQQYSTFDDQKASSSWTLCTVDQVEELKALIKVIPIWSTGMLISINISQNSFPVLQATSMDRHITSSFEIPAGSFGMFSVISATLWIGLYDRVILPLASKITGGPFHLTTKQRMGIGILFSFLAMLWTAILESIRRRLAINEGYSDMPQAMVPMSAMWIVPQYLFTGFAEAMNVIGQNEFYFSEFPRSMSSIALTLNGLGMSGGSLLASFVMSSVDRWSKSEGGESWVTSNINKGRYDYYYCVLAGLSLFNMVYFLVCSWAYGPCDGEGLRPWDEGGDSEDE